MLLDPCESLPGVGPAIAKKLRQCGIQTVSDLLFHLPYRYQDRTRITPIRDLRANDWCVVTGTVCKVEIKYGRRRMLICYLDDKTGILKLRFFNFNQQQVLKFQQAPTIQAFSEVRAFADQLEMIHPEYQLLQSDDDITVDETLTPIYPTTQGLTQKRLRELIKLALNHVEQELASLEWMDIKTREQKALPNLAEAIISLHQPPPDVPTESFEAGTHPALKRLIIEEFTAHQLSMQFARAKRETQRAPALPSNADALASFLTSLPFSLTNAQARVTQEIQCDLSQQKPMLRLVQGDVGSGKTVVAAIAALQAITNGYQVALMAPTEILSEQHAHNLKPWFEKAGIRLLHLSGKIKSSARKEVLEKLAQHECDLIVGTHALFQKQVTFSKLGLIIIDEQHRFGVEQRLELQQKGQTTDTIPHQLLMTATPIPRTLAMAQYAHLALSIINELPPGRTPVTTAVLNQTNREPIIERLEEAIQSGQQAYWVCPLIEDSEKLQCIAATTTAEQLKEQLPSVNVGLVHGRMKPEEKEQTMADFKAKKLDLLVATSVIEVGVDVANASLMIIENAERMGLSQLHQLRGRVGRGHAQSYCLLLYQPPLSQTAGERLRVMRSSNDGFVIAEKDLQLRGSGEFLGTRQTGYRHYKLADIQRDQALLAYSQSMAKRLLQNEPDTADMLVKRWLGDVNNFLSG